MTCLAKLSPYRDTDCNRLLRGCRNQGRSEWTFAPSSRWGRFWSGRISQSRLWPLEFGRVGGIIGAEGDRSGGMKYRIAVWAGVGFLAAGVWAVYASATFP